jgi:hypothetical protein
MLPNIHMHPADEFSKPAYKGQRVFIDVLVVPQMQVTSPEVVQTTKSNYRDCWVVIFLKGSIFTRAWCCLEAAICTSAKCKISVVGTLDSSKGSNYFDTMQATVESDVALIKQEIMALFGSPDRFNSEVARASNDILQIMQANIEMMLQRSDDLERLEQQSGELSAQAEAFAKAGKAMKSRSSCCALA